MMRPQKRKKYVLGTAGAAACAAASETVGGGADAGYWLYPTRNNSPPSNVFSATGTNNANYYNSGYTDPTNYLTSVGAFSSSPGPYGTFDMGGNVWELNDTIVNGSYRSAHGGSWNNYYDTLATSYRQVYYNPTDATIFLGFRVASAIPEPSTLIIWSLLGALGTAAGWHRRRKPA